MHCLHWPLLANVHIKRLRIAQPGLRGFGHGRTVLLQISTTLSFGHFSLHPLLQLVVTASQAYREVKMTSHTYIAGGSPYTQQSSSLLATSTQVCAVTTCAPSCERRNSFDMVADTLAALEVAATGPNGSLTKSGVATTSLRQEPEQSSTAPTPRTPATARPFQREGNASFEGYENIELSEMPATSPPSPAVNSTIAAIKPLPTAHVVGASAAPATSQSTSKANVQNMAAATRQAFRGAPQSLADEGRAILSCLWRGSSS